MLKMVERLNAKEPGINVNRSPECAFAFALSKFELCAIINKRRLRYSDCFINTRKV